MLKSWRGAIIMVVCMAMSGCIARLPTYPAMSDEAALRAMAERQESIKSVSAQCDLTLTGADGQTVHLDGVLIAQPPGRARLRAWKFGQAVFDLTLIDGAAWMVAPDENADSHRMDPSRLPARSVSDAIDLLGPAFFRAAKPDAAGSSGSTLLARGPALGRDDVSCQIDRPTLTARRFTVVADRVENTSELFFDRYAMVGNIPWARSIRLRSPAGEIIVRLHDVELNCTIPPEAFVPPRRAKRLP